MTNLNERGSTFSERLVQHAIQAITVVAILGGAKLLFDLRTDVAVLVSQQKTITEKLQDTRLDRYTASQARRDFDDIKKRLSDHEMRLRKLETES